MDDDIDDERDFWHDEPTRRLSRVVPRAPFRAQVSSVPRDITGNVQRTRHHALARPEPRELPGPTRPLVTRLALLVGLAVVMIPVAVTLRHGASDVLRATPVGTVAAAPLAEPIAATVMSLPTITDPPSPVALEMPAAPTTEFDIDALAPAVPVNDVTVSSGPAVTAPATTTAATPVPDVLPSATVTEPPTTAATDARMRSAPAASTRCATTYVVLSGDYWILIAGKFGVAVNDLLSVNHATTFSPLYPGRTICLPDDAVAVAPRPTPAPAPAPSPSTSMAPTTTSPPPTTLPSRTYTAAEVESIIREVWPDDLEDEAIRIARRESNLQPTARNACCYGLFQIYWSVHRGWLNAMGITSAAHLFDPRANATAGYALYQRSGGWGPWAL